MAKQTEEKRLQVNVRIKPEDLAAIERLRRAKSPLPSASEVILEALREADRRLSKKGGK